MFRCSKNVWFRMCVFVLDECQTMFSFSSPSPYHFLNAIQWVELSEKERRQKVDRACRDAKKNSVASSLVSKPSKPTPVPPTAVTATHTATTKVTVPTTTAVPLPPSTMERLYPLSRGMNIGSHNNSVNNHGNQVANAAANSIRDNQNESGSGSKNKRKSREDVIVATNTTNTPPTSTGTNATTTAVVDIRKHPTDGVTSSLVTNVIAPLIPVQSSTVALANRSSNRTDSLNNAATAPEPIRPSNFFHIGHQTYHDIERPTIDLPSNSSRDHNDHSNSLETSISSLDKMPLQTIAVDAPLLPSTVSTSRPYMTAPTLEFSCGSLVLDNSFVLPEHAPHPHHNPNHSNNTNTSTTTVDDSKNNYNNLSTIESSLLPPPPQQHQPPQGLGHSRNAMNALLKKPCNNINLHTNNNSNNGCGTSISSIPNEFFNRSGISEMDFSAVSLDFFPPVEEEDTEQTTDTEEHDIIPHYVADCTNQSTTSTASTATSITDANDPSALLRGEGNSSTTSTPQHESMNRNSNNDSVIMMDASVSVLDLNQSYTPGSFFDASYNNSITTNNNSLMLESASAIVFTNPNDRRKEPIRRPVDANSSTRQQPERFLDRYDLLKREESVDTIIAGNLRRHSQISKGGVCPKGTDVDENDLSASFNMSLDICALPSTHEEDDDEDETPKPERGVKEIFVAQKQEHPQPHLLSEEYQRSPEKKKLKDNTTLPSMTQLASNISSSLWSSTDEFTMNRGNDSASITSSLFSV